MNQQQQQEEEERIVARVEIALRIFH